MSMAMLLDISKCTACRGCQAACKEWNDLNAVSTYQQGTYQNPPALNPTTYTLIEFIEHEDKNGQFAWTFFNKRCLHCTQAACVDVCPTEALKHDAMGFVSLEQDLCNGCGYCAEACPFGVPKLDVKNVLTGEAKATKCNFCQDRMHNDLVPACAKACPTGAIAFGEREELVATGRQRVSQLKTEGYAEARLYGETELGGLGQMYVLPQQASFFGLPEDPQVPAVATAWQKAVQPFGYAAVGLTVLGLGFNWLAQRKNALALLAETATPPPEKEEE
ncbi:MAG: 4Fe-4S dicluster domain-containing protein [Anaerolineae bacterium]